MATDSEAVLIHQIGSDEIPIPGEGKKKLEEMLLDPRVLAITESFPERKEEIANMVRKLQADRAVRKGKSCKNETGNEPPWTSKLLSTFDCTNFVRLFTAQPRDKCSRSRKTCRRHPMMAAAGDAPACFSKDVSQPLDLSIPKDLIEPKSMSNFTLKEIKFHINGMDVHSPAVFRKKYEDIAEVLLQKASLSSSSLFFNFLPPEAKHILMRVIHDLEGNNCTNLKTVRANLIPTKSDSAVIILEPSKITEAPVYSLALDLNAYRPCTSSSTQTDIIGSGCCCYECEMTNECCLFQDIEANENPKFEVVQFTHNMTQMTSASSIQSYSANKEVIHSRFIRSAASPVHSKCSETNVCRNEDDSSSGDSESDLDHPLDVDSGARYLSKILRNSKPPDRNLISPEVVITCSGRNNCNGKCCEAEDLSSGSCDFGRNSSCETVAFDCSQHVNKWPRKRLKTSCESYYADESATKIVNARLQNDFNCHQTSVIIEEGANHNDRPPEISTGYSQLSYREDGNYISDSEDEETSQTVKNEFYDQSGLTIKIFTESDDLGESKDCIESNTYQIFEENYREENIESPLSDEGSYGNISNNEYFINDLSSDFRHFNYDQRRSPVFPKKFEPDLDISVKECPEFRRPTCYSLPRRSSSAMSAVGSLDISKQNTLQTKGSKRDIVAVKNHQNNDILDLPGECDFSSNEEQNVLSTFEKSVTLEQEELSSSEEEHRRMFERNLKTMKMKVKTDDGECSTSSRSHTPPLPPWKAKRQSQGSHEKSKDKWKHKHCSIM